MTAARRPRCHLTPLTRRRLHNFRATRRGFWPRWMIWPPLRFRYGTINYQLPAPAPTAPSRENWLGTDDQGRDLTARLLYGFRISVLFGLVLTLGSSVIG